MRQKRLTGLAATAVFLSGCGGHERATLNRADGAQVKVTVRALTGDGVESLFDASLPPGSRVTVLDKSIAGTLARVRIEEGDFKDLEAFVPRTGLRPE